MALHTPAHCRGGRANHANLLMEGKGMQNTEGRKKLIQTINAADAAYYKFEDPVTERLGLPSS